MSTRNDGRSAHRPSHRNRAAQLAGQLSRRFRIVRRLGAGAMGTVFLAEQVAIVNRQRRLGRRC